MTNADSLAAEMAAFANSEGGVIYLGVADDGSLPGLSRADVARINQLISNTASQHIRSPITVLTENLELDSNRLVIVLTVPKGIDKPYFDRNGVIWLKSGADKRRINSKEELRRLFQSVDQFHADELPTKAGIDKLDRLRFRDFLRDFYKQEFPDAAEERLTLLQNMNLATDSGMLNLAGVVSGKTLGRYRPWIVMGTFVFAAVATPSTAKIVQSAAVCAAAEALDGATMPSRPSPLASTCLVAATSASRDARTCPALLSTGHCS